MGTTYYDLYKPPKDSLGWAALVGTNFDTIDEEYAAILTEKQDTGSNAALVPAALDASGGLVSSELPSLYETTNREYIRWRNTSVSVLLLHDVVVYKIYLQTSIAPTSSIPINYFCSYSTDNGATYPTILGAELTIPKGSVLSNVQTYSPGISFSAGTILRFLKKAYSATPTGATWITFVCSNTINEIVPSFPPGPTPGPTS